MVLPNLLVFRKYGRAAMKKRVASVYHAIAVFLITIVAASVVSFGLSDYYLALGVGVIGIAAYLLRKRMFPYRLTCPKCGRKHDLFSAEFKNVYVMDDDLCDVCRAAETDPAD